MMTRERFPTEIVTPRTLVRRAVAGDLLQITAWPGYPLHLSGFDMSQPSSSNPGGKRWWEKIDAPDRCHYSVVLPQTGEVIGIEAFIRIDWDNTTVGNMVIRIRPDVCGQGYGTETLQSLLQAVLACGVESIRLDVAATNTPAVHCYETCGMKIVEEFWNEHKGQPIDFTDPYWQTRRNHFREEDDKWMVRFYWMEIQNAPIS